MRVTELIQETDLTAAALWKPVANVERWDLFDDQLSEVQLQGYEPQYVYFSPRFYRWRRMRIDTFATGAKISLVARLPQTRVRTTFSICQRRHGSYIHARIRFVGWLSMLWAMLFAWGYRHRVEQFVNAWLNEAYRLEQDRAHSQTAEDSAATLRIDSPSELPSPHDVSVHAAQS